MMMKLIAFIYPHRPFIPQASNIFGSFLLDSKLQAQVSMVTSLPLRRVFPKVKYMSFCDGLITSPEKSNRVSNCISDHRIPERGPMFHLGTYRKMNE
jgi:hypothetical protein